MAEGLALVAIPRWAKTGVRIIFPFLTSLANLSIIRFQAQ